MGIYVDADDIKQHFTQGRALSNEVIEEIMSEQEYYVQTRLGLTELPPNNPLLAGIIRDLTIASGITNLAQPNADNLGKADSLRIEALRRLGEADRNGIGIVVNNPPRSPENEVINPYGNSPFFVMGDYFDR